jgi:hypothetical protein
MSYSLFKQWVLAMLSVIIGITTNLIIQDIAKKNLTEIGEKCLSGEVDNLIPYEPMLGGSFVCIVNNLFYGLKQVPEGIFAWCCIIAVYFPVAILVTVEATRVGVQGILKYPFFIFFLSQYIALSVAFPLVWVPMFLLWGRGSLPGFLSYHANTASFSGLFISALSFAFFAFETQAHVWRLATSLLFGPLLPVPYLTLFLLPSNLSGGLDSSSRIIKSYYSAALVSFFLWSFSLYLLVINYGTSMSIIGVLWTETNFSVQIINLDWFVWYLSILIIIVAENWIDGSKTMLMMPFLGPGAALAITLARQEQVRCGRVSEKAD